MTRKSTLFLLLFIICYVPSELFAQGPWVEVAFMPGPQRHRASAFCIGNKGYLGTGWNGVTFYGDFWEYDPSTNTWTQKADFPPGPTLSMTYFAIGNYGYLTNGLNVGGWYETNLWRYDPTINTWTAVCANPDGGDFGVKAFVIGTKAYIQSSNNPGMTDVYDASSNSWTALANPGILAEGVAFTINGKGYAGIDDSAGNDLWCFDPGTGMWTQMTMFPAEARVQAVGFALDGYGYVTTGRGNMTGTIFKDCWQFDPVQNSWRQINNFGGAPRWKSVAFVVGHKAFLSCGTDGNNFQDTWEFSPENITGIAENSTGKPQLSIYPNPMNTSASFSINGYSSDYKNLILDIYTLEGKLVQSLTVQSATTTINRNSLTTGTYFYNLHRATEKLGSGKFIITD